jgi:hypothetical protein
MKPLRRLGTALWLALALLVGQQAAALHDLGHAIQQVEHKGSTPASNTCDECFACAQLGAAVGIDPPVIPQDVATDAAPRLDAWSSPHAAPRIAFLSTGPPART